MARSSSFRLGEIAPDSVLEAALRARTSGELLRIIERARLELFRPAPPPPPSRVASAKADRAIAAERGEVELRIEVIDALVASGVARSVAAERTNTAAKLDAEADALGLL